MYAHKVIECMERVLRVLKNEDAFLDYSREENINVGRLIKSIRATIIGIRGSMKFHLGNVYDLTSVAGIQDAVDPIPYAKKVFEQIPFDRCFFSLHFNSNHKAGVVIQKSDEIMTVRHIDKYPRAQHELVSEFGNNYWEASPFVGEVTLENGAPKLKIVQIGELNPKVDSFKNEREIQSEIIMVVGAFLGLLECKNIQTKVVEPPLKLNKKRIRNGKPPLFEYRIAELVVPNIKKGGGGPGGGGGSRQRVHLCRGHIKHYTNENPLFGKYTGKWWWQPIVRGSKAQGFIHKSYRVRASRKEGVK